MVSVSMAAAEKKKNIRLSKRQVLRKNLNHDFGRIKTHW